MSPVPGIAILGAGIFAKEAHLPALAALGNLAPPLKAVYSRSEKSAHDLADAATVALHLDTTPAIYHDGDKSTDLDALLERDDINAVIVVLPITLQPSIILKALAAGKHVLSEKPIAPDVEQGLKLIDQYNTQFKSKGLIWRVAENWEAEPGYRAAAVAIQAGKIGKVISFKTVVVNYIDKESKWYKTPWRTIPDVSVPRWLPGERLLAAPSICLIPTKKLDGGVHTIAALRVLLPEPLTHLSGFASLNKEYLKPHDTIHAIVKAGSHIRGTAELTWAHPTMSRPTTDGFVITGSDGWLSINNVKNTIRTVIKSVVKVEDKPDQEKEEIIEEVSKGVEAELESFFSAMDGKDDGLGLGDPLGALRDVAFIQASLNSEGELVDLQKLVSA